MKTGGGGDGDAGSDDGGAAWPPLAAAAAAADAMASCVRASVRLYVCGARVSASGSFFSSDEVLDAEKGEEGG